MASGDLSKIGKNQFLFKGGQNTYNHYKHFHDHINKSSPNYKSLYGIKSKRYIDRVDEKEEEKTYQIFKSLSVRDSIEDHPKLRKKGGTRLEHILSKHMFIKESKDQDLNILTLKSSVIEKNKGSNVKKVKFNSPFKRSMKGSSRSPFSHQYDPKKSQNLHSNYLKEYFNSHKLSRNANTQ